VYLPSHFRETGRARLETLVRDYPFATLVTVRDGAPCANHLPLLHEPAAGGAGRRLGHMARATPQWRDLAAGQPALAVFHGPHAYVSPGWYATPGVPTWNYAVVHARGRARVLEQPGEARVVLERLTAAHEAAQARPWRVDPDDPALGPRLAAIVAFEIVLDSLEGKFKLSQNRPAADRERVRAQFARAGETALAALMAQAGDTAGGTG